MLLIAHRGASREHRENTLPAFARALELGADGIELDVHATADGIIVVHHDFALPRTPHFGHLGGAAVNEITLPELEALRLPPALRVPTLDDICRLVGDRLELFVEIKGRGIEAGVLACLARHRGPFAVHSFDHGAIERAAQLAPDVRRGLLFDEPPDDLEDSVGRAGALDVWPRGDLATPDLVERAHALGVRVIAWTVNERPHAEILAARGVDGLCSDDIRTLEGVSR